MLFQNHFSFSRFFQNKKKDRKKILSWHEEEATKSLKLPTTFYMLLFLFFLLKTR
jgi:hypothetical protein